MKGTLKAVISMPNELFYPVAANTCIMVWQADIPNDDNETWFGYLKEDGFEKRKNRGRVQYKGFLFTSLASKIQVSMFSMSLIDV